MTSPLERLSGPGKSLSVEAPDAKEFDGLRRSGLARLKDAGNSANALESRFDLAYNAAHALCLAALRYRGYRAVNRYIVFQVQTYIASGNVIFESAKSEKAVKTALESAVQKYAGKPVGVHVRTPAELKKIFEANPFPKAAPNHTVVYFLDESPPKDALRTITGMADEEVHLGKREIYVCYGSGMARSKLKIPAAKGGTARNMNTIAKLADLTSAHSD